MHEINTFSLERYSGEYQGSARSHLINDGVMLALTLPGCDLLRQYTTVDGYLFVTDYDCPFEERTCFILVDKSLKRILSEHGFGGWYNSGCFDDLFWLDDRNFTAIISHEPFHFKIRRFYIPYLYPKLGVKVNYLQFRGGRPQ